MEKVNKNIFRIFFLQPESCFALTWDKIGIFRLCKKKKKVHLYLLPV